MNILILIPSLSSGGAEKQAIVDANLLCRSNNVTLLYFRGGPFEEQIDGNVNNIHIPETGYLKRTICLTGIVKEKKIDIIHASIFSAMIIAVLSSFITNVRVVWSFHSHELDIPKKSYLAYRFLGQAKGLKRIMFVNRDLLKYWKHRCNFNNSKLGILYNCGTSQEGSLVNSKLDKVILGYVGRLVELKRIDYIIQLGTDLVMNGYSDFQILIIGDGPLKGGLEQEVMDRNLSDYIEFTGYRANLAEYYEKMDMYLQASREECLSISMIDAGLAGVPIVAFNVGGNSEIVLDNKSGFIVNSYQEFYHKTKNLLQNRILREKMGDVGMEHCQSKFSPNEHLEKLIELYESIITD